MELAEVIVRYYGSIEEGAAKLGGVVELLSDSYAIVDIPEENINKLSNEENIIYIELPKILALNYEVSGEQVERRLTENMYALTGKGVLVGIIDSGIDYENRAFINDDGDSRIAYIWDQSIEGNAPRGFKRGYEYTNEDINNAIRSGEKIQHTDSEGHGTAVAGICAGREGVASESSLIVVKLGETGRAYFGRSTEIMRAVKYIYDKAEEMNMPVVINISFGTNNGSHDGTSLFEGYINEMALRQRSSVIVSSGNEGASGHHYRGRIEDGEEKTVEFTVVAGVGDIFLTGWKSYVDRMNFELISPDNTSTGEINYNSEGEEAVLGGSQVLFVLGRPSPYNISQEVYISIRNAQSGIWRLIIRGVRIVDGNIDIWLPVTEAVTRDTAFLSPEPKTTLTLPSSALNVITVGGYDPINESIASFSGRGYTRSYCVVKPDIAAPAVNVTSVKVGGGRDAYTGTSFAAPFVTGTAALLMQWGTVLGNDPSLYGQRLKAAIRSAARRRDNVTYPNDEWGYGILDINNTIGQLIRIGGVKIQEAEEELENAIYSEEYIDLITPFNEQIQNILDENTNVRYFKFFSNQYAILYVPRNYYRIFLENDGKYIVNTESKVFGLMQSDELINSGVIQVRNNLGLRGAGTLVGILDTGINYRDEEFLYEDNTSRIAYIWDQTKRGEEKGENVRYGREYSNHEINEALSGGEDIDVNDENGHGTLLAKLSAGRISGAAPDAELVIVKLKPAKQSIREDNYIFTDAVGFETSDIMTAVNYLYSISQRLGKPISICIGLGTNTGSHSGYSVIESFMGQIALKNGVIICAATGNEGNAGHHSYGTIEKGISKSIEISVGEGERGFIADIWTYVPDKIVLSITSPLWETIRNIQILPNYSQSFKLPLSEGEITITYYSSLPEGELELYEIKMLNPTSGIWQINITGEEVYSGFYHSWLPISDFLRSDTVFLSSDSYTTLTIPSSGTSIIAVGGYNAADGRIYPPSGRGPSTIGKLEPLLVAPVSQGGTSTAAALTGGIFALLLEWAVVRGNNPIINSAAAVTFAIRGTEKTENILFPNNIWGFGTINIYESFRKLL